MIFLSCFTVKHQLAPQSIDITDVYDIGHFLEYYVIERSCKGFTIISVFYKLVCTQVAPVKWQILATSEHLIQENEIKNYPYDL